MKQIIFLTLAFSIAAHAEVIGQRVNEFKVQNATMKSCLEQIEAKTGLGFIYNGKEVENISGISLHLKDVEVSELLDCLLKGTGYTHLIVEGVIALIKEPASPPTQTPRAPNHPESVEQQQPVITATGRVVDAKGAPLAGATVVLKGTPTITITDSDGQFRITIPQVPATLQFSFIGMQSKEIVFRGEALTVLLEELLSPINEVQVIAYGTTLRKFNTGSSSTVKGEVIGKQPTSDLMATLQGRMNGLYIEPYSSTPGSNPTVTVRGNSVVRLTTAGAPIKQAPLFILDGVPIPYSQTMVGSGIETREGFSTLLNINTMDIESIDVLKDADAAALYGSRGANGVVLITTKKGRAGKVKVDINAYTGFSTFPRFLNMWNTDEYLAAREETLANDGLTPTVSNAPDLLVWDKSKYTDWQKELFGRTASTNNVNVSVSGGSGNTTFYVNAGYRSEETVMMKGTAHINKTARLNLNHSSDNRKFKFNVIAGIGQFKILLPATTMLIQLYDLPPHYPTETADGSPEWNAGRSYPYSYLLQKYNATSNSYNANADISYDVWKGLKLKLSGGANSMVSDQESKSPAASQNPANSPTGYMTKGNNNNFGWIMEPQLTYDGQFDKHRISFLLGGAWEKSYTDYLYQYGYGFTNDAMMTVVSAANTLTTTETPSEYAYGSLFARLTYHYNDKYLLNLSYRRDGSSRFGPEKKFGNFGAVGAAWIFSSESLVKESLPFLSFGKLRGSYGVLGNDNIGDYIYASTYTTYSSGTSAYNGTALRPTTIANPGLMWEENRKLELALELGFLKDRFWASVSWFRNRTDNQLLNYPISVQSGFTSYTTNFSALVQNMGWEFEVNTRNINNENFQWKTQFNFSLSNNKLVEFPDIAISSYANYYTVGKSLNILKAYKYEGMDNRGVPILADLDGSGTITSTGDQYFVGNSDPRFGSMTNTFTYKNVDFSFFLQYQRYYGVTNVLPQYLSPVRTGRSQAVYFNDRWQQAGDEATANFPRFTSVSTFYNYSNYRISDVNYGTTHVFRLTNLSLQYSFPSEWVSKIGLEHLRVYILGQNLYTWDKLRKSRFDPVTGNATMPQLRTWTFGINCTF